MPAAKKPAKALKTRQEKKEETRERVRLAARALFSEVGFDETTTKAVAERAGVATGTVFVHARDKVDLLCMVMHDELAGAVEGAFTSIPDAPLLDQLLHVFRSVFAAYGRIPKLAPAFVKNTPSADGPNGVAVNGLTFDFIGRIGALVAGAQARGEIAADIPPMLLAQNVFALYFLALFGWVSGMTTLETALDPQLKSSLALMLRGLDR